MLRRLGGNGAAEGSPFSRNAAAMAACAVLEAEALTLFRRWTRWLLLVAERDKEFECDRLEEETREKLPETGRETT